MRAWNVTGVHGSPTRMRLADSHGPALPRPDERIAVVEVGTWRAVWLALRAAVASDDEHPPA